VDVVVDDVALRAEGPASRSGRPRLGKPDEDAEAGAAVDDFQRTLIDGDVGEDVGSCAAEEAVVADPRSQRVVAVAAAEGGEDREAAAADESVVAVLAAYVAAVAGD